LTDNNDYGWGTYIDDTENPSNLTWWQGDPLWSKTAAGDYRL